MLENHELVVRDILIKTIEQAKNSIRMAISYFNDLDVANLIKKKAEEGVRVEIVIYDHFINSPAILELTSYNIITHFYSADSTQPIYPKFCVIDGEILFTGNYGWAYAAARVEHPDPLIVNNEHRLVEEYLNKFNIFKKMCGTSRLVHFRIRPEKKVHY